MNDTFHAAWRFMQMARERGMSFTSTSGGREEPFRVRRKLMTRTAYQHLLEEQAQETFVVETRPSTPWFVFRGHILGEP